MDGIALLFAADTTADPRTPVCTGSEAVADDDPTRACLLLCAPPEIRTLIYEHVVRDRHAYPLVASFQAPQFQRQPGMGYEYIGEHQMRPRRRLNRRSRPGHTLHKPVRCPPALGLLLACRQTYFEFSSVFYSAQTLNFRGSDEVNSFTIQMFRCGKSLLPSTGLLPTPVYLGPKLHLFISTPATQLEAHTWTSSLLALAQHGPGHLRELTVTFYHCLPTPAESAAGLPELLGPDWRDWVPYQFSDEEVKEPLVDIARNDAFAVALCMFQGLERLDIRGLIRENWPAILDKYLDRRHLELQRAGFKERITNEDYSKEEHTFRAVYRGKACSSAHDGTAADGQQERRVPRIESEGTRHSLVATLEDAW